MMGFIDTVMAGRVSAVDMAAVAVGTSLWLPAILFVQGLLMAFTPLFAHYNGANNQSHPTFSLSRCLSCHHWWRHWRDDFPRISALCAWPYGFRTELYRLTIGYLDGILWGARICSLSSAARL